VRAMIDGRKAGPPEDGIRHARILPAVLLLAAVLGFWWLQWQGAPAGDAAGRPAAVSRDEDRHHHDDD